MGVPYRLRLTLHPMFTFVLACDPQLVWLSLSLLNNTYGKKKNDE